VEIRRDSAAFESSRGKRSVEISNRRPRVHNLSERFRRRTTEQAGTRVVAERNCFFAKSGELGATKSTIKKIHENYQCARSHAVRYARRLRPRKNDFVTDC